jgi:hypothetical protein
MKDEYNKNGILTGPLIFTLPTSSFLVVLSLNWIDGTDRPVASAKRTTRTIWQLGRKRRALSLASVELLTRAYRI